jgi:hypothetical protein
LEVDVCIPGMGDYGYILHSSIARRVRIHKANTPIKIGYNIHKR